MSVKDKVAALKAKHHQLNQPKEKPPAIEAPSKVPPQTPQPPKPQEQTQQQPKKKKKKPKESSLDRRERMAARYGRLPDASMFVAAYEAATQTWTGSLSIPGLQPFQGAASGVFWLMTSLDKMYRAHVEAIAEKNAADADSRCQGCGAPQGQPHGLECLGEGVQ